MTNFFLILLNTIKANITSLLHYVDLNTQSVIREGIKKITFLSIFQLTTHTNTLFLSLLKKQNLREEGRIEKKRRINS